MRRQAVLVMVGFTLFFGSVMRADAQVKRVQMHIAGYLCGN